MNLIRNSFAVKLLSFLFALHVFNISVDPPDANPYWAPKDISTNEMESISEIVFEEILHINNAFPEFDKHPNPDHGAPMNVHLEVVFYQSVFFQTIPLEILKENYIKQNENLFDQFSEDVLIPPPKA